MTNHFRVVNGDTLALTAWLKNTRNGGADAVPKGNPFVPRN
jgi:hypothetical protein